MSIYGDDTNQIIAFIIDQTSTRRSVNLDDLYDKALVLANDRSEHQTKIHGDDTWSVDVREYTMTLYGFGHGFMHARGLTWVA